MESTFMMQTCRIANFRPLLRSPPVRHAMPEFIQALEDVRREDRRGMRLDSLLRLDDECIPQGDFEKKARRITLDPSTMLALVDRLNAQGVRYHSEDLSKPAPMGVVPLSSSAVSCSQIAISGVLYKIRTRAQGDSNIIFHHPSLRRTRPGRILQIFIHSRPSTEDRSSITETFLVVERLQSLKKKDRKLDPYRQFPGVGGWLCYDAYLPNVYVILPEDVVCHFVKTLMHTFPGKNHPTDSGTDDTRAEVAQDSSTGSDSDESTDEEGRKARSHSSIKVNRTYTHVRPLDRVSLNLSYL